MTGFEATGELSLEGDLLEKAREDFISGRGDDERFLGGDGRKVRREREEKSISRRINQFFLIVLSLPLSLPSLHIPLPPRANGTQSTATSSARTPPSAKNHTQPDPPSFPPSLPSSHRP